MKNIFIWAAAHKITEEQKEELESKGTLLFLEDIDDILLKDLCNIDQDTDLQYLINSMSEIEAQYGITKWIQPAGNPRFQAFLGRSTSFNLMYAFSKRESIDMIQEDGSVIKKAVFRHICFQEL